MRLRLLAMRKDTASRAVVAEVFLFSRKGRLLTSAAVPSLRLLRLSLRQKGPAAEGENSASDLRRNEALVQEVPVKSERSLCVG